MSILNYNSFFFLVNKAIAEKQPFSFVRMGDGESIVIGYPEFTTEREATARYAKWFALPEGPTAWMHLVSTMIRDACEYADIVGLPGPRHASLGKSWRNVEVFAKRYGILSGHTCQMDFVIDLQMRDDFRRLIRGKSVRCITCRNVSGVLRTLGASTVETFYLPPQVKPAFGTDYSKAPHYPECFTSIQEWIKSTPGGIYLVGAGGLGKIYCQWVKELGGVALDIGSTFDGWAGYPTRSYLRAMLPRYKVLPANPRIER